MNDFKGEMESPHPYQKGCTCHECLTYSRAKNNGLKVGDRVRCLGQPTDGTFQAVSLEGDLGMIVNFNHGFVQVSLDNDYGHEWFEFHPKQIRKLKPKREPRRIWIYKDTLENLFRSSVGGANVYQTIFNHPVTDTVEFQEVAPKRKKL